MSKKRLGRGIDALLQGRDLEQLERLSSVVTVPVDRIKPNPNQPRRSFSKESLADLAASIREKGIIQPILAEDQGDGTYTIVAGERRYRAAKLAELNFVPVLPIEITETESLEIALIENVQREDLNAIEEAQGYRSLMEAVGYTQDQLATKLGKSRAAIANTLRLLRLPPELQDYVVSGRLTEGHARAILGAGSEANIGLLGKHVVEAGLSVRNTEVLAGRLAAGESLESVLADEAAAAGPESQDGDATVPEDGASSRDHTGARGATGTKSADRAAVAKPAELKALEDRLIEHLGTRVVVQGSETKGKIEISYLSVEDFERIFEIITGGPVGP